MMLKLYTALLRFLVVRLYEDQAYADPWPLYKMEIHSEINGGKARVTRCHLPDRSFMKTKRRGPKMMLKLYTALLRFLVVRLHGDQAYADPWPLYKMEIHSEINGGKARVTRCYLPDRSFMFTPGPCVDFQAMRCESTTLNRIMADKSHV